MSIENRITEAIRDVPDFPKEGILFKDITPIMLDAELCNDILDQLVDRLSGQELDGIAGIESRGFIFGPSLAFRLGVPFILIRKKGKLPARTISQTYMLEYGSAVIEMHEDAIESGQQILIHDDVLATGGTAAAAAELILKQNGKVAGFDFLIDLTFLNGRERISQYSENISNLVSF